MRQRKNKKTFSSRNRFIEPLEARRLMAGGDYFAEPIFPQNADGYCSVFEVPPTGTTYDVGDELPKHYPMERLGVTNFLIAGEVFEDGQATIQKVGSSGGVGQELVVENRSLEINFAESVSEVYFDFNSLSEEHDWYNIKIDGGLNLGRDIFQLDGKRVGGAEVTITETDDGFRLSAKGKIDRFLIGGGQLHIDNLCSVLPDDHGPVRDFGDAPASYGTLEADGGASHIFVPGAFLGATIDFEVDGQPTSLAYGDNNDNVNDDDGVITGIAMVPGETATFEVTAASDGFLNAWVDFKSDGTFGLGDRIAGSLLLEQGSNIVAFDVPADALVGATFSRFRFTPNDRLVGPTNTIEAERGGELTIAAPGGEVEDYFVAIRSAQTEEEIFDFGDASQPNYRTTISEGGAKHIVTPGVHLGSTVDAEVDGIASNGTGDDLDGVDDENGVEFATAPLRPGEQETVIVNASTEGWLNAWIDYDHDGDWEPNEEIFSGLLISAGDNTLTFTLPTDRDFDFGNETMSLFRFSTDQQFLSPLSVFGGHVNGEAEVHPVTIQPAPESDPVEPNPGFPRGDFEFGDAPNTYGTRKASNGPIHEVDPNIYLGSRIDAEPDGQPGPQALGDNLNPSFASNDEDGVYFINAIAPGFETAVRVTASSFGHLNAWIDMDRNGSFDAGDQIFKSELLAPGPNVLRFTTPAGADIGDTFTRFRFSSTHKVLAPKGRAEDAMGNFEIPNGEVEDYRVRISKDAELQYDFGEAQAIYGTKRENNGAMHRVVPGVFLGERVDAEGDAQPNPTATGDDDRPGPTPDDEDGVVVTSKMIAGQMATVNVTASTNGYLTAFVDFDGDLRWTQDEMLFASRPISQGVNSLQFYVPQNAIDGDTTTRWRFSTQSGITSPFSYVVAPDDEILPGEVEDHLFEIAGSNQNREDSQPVRGDYNDDGVVDLEDVDLFSLFMQGKFDIKDNITDWNEDGEINSQDLRYLVEEVWGSVLGDVDGDKEAGFSDFLQLSQNFEVGDCKKYSEGDANGDGKTDFRDFLLFSSVFGRRGRRPVAVEVDEVFAQA